MAEKVNNVFETLNGIDLSGKTEEKIGLNYLSWANAWGELKKYYPDAFYTVYTREEQIDEEITIEDNGVTKKTITHSKVELPYFTDNKTCFVKVGVTVEGTEYIEYLPVMDNRNNSIRADLITSTAVNKAVQRAFVKACARHGLGLYIYAGEDLPENKRFNPKEVINNANNIEVQPIDEESFKILKDQVIQIVSQKQNSWPADIQETVFNYAGYLFGGKKLSALELSDNKELQRFNFLLTEVKEW